MPDFSQEVQKPLTKLLKGCLHVDEASRYTAADARGRLAKIVVQQGWNNRIE